MSRIEKAWKDRTGRFVMRNQKGISKIIMYYLYGIQSGE